MLKQQRATITTSNGEKFILEGTPGYITFQINMAKGRGDYGKEGTFAVFIEDIPPNYKDQRKSEYTPIDPERDEGLVERVQGRPEKFNAYSAKRSAIKAKFPKPAGETPPAPDTPLQKAQKLLGNMITPNYFMLALLEKEVSKNKKLWDSLEGQYKNMLQVNGIDSKELVP